MPEVDYAPCAAEQEQDGVCESGDQISTVWDKLSESNPFEREMACRTLAQIDFDETLVARVIAEGQTGRLLSLLSDPVLTVREAAAMALRKMCPYDSKTHCCDHLVSMGAVKVLEGHLMECLHELQPSDAAAREGRATPAQLFSAIEEALNLLWNLCEQADNAVKAFNETSLLALIVRFLQLQQFPLSVVTAAAQCLHIVTEDNAVAVQSLCGISESLSLLEGLLLQPVREDFEFPGGLWSLKTSAAGVLFNLVSVLQEPTYTTTMRAILSVIATVLDVGVDSLLFQLETQEQKSEQLSVVENGHDTSGVGSDDVRQDGDSEVKDEEAGSNTVTVNKPPALSKKFTDVDAMLNSQQLALELLINICAMEDDDQWEDTGEDCEVDMDVDDKGTSHTSAPQAEVVRSLAELGLFTKVLKICCSINGHTYKLCEAVEGGKEIAQILNTLQDRSLCALQNLLTVLPYGVLGGKDNLVGVWRSLLELMQHGGEFLHPTTLVDIMASLIEKLGTHGSMDVTIEEFKFLCQIGLTSFNPVVRSGIMHLLGIAGKVALSDAGSPASKSLLNVIGSTLRDCVSSDSLLWVTCYALDSIFDVFGEDECPIELYHSLGLPAVLNKAEETFSSRMTSQHDEVKLHHKAIRCAKCNLPAFIHYMTERASGKT